MIVHGNEKGKGREGKYRRKGKLMEGREGKTREVKERGKYMIKEKEGK